MTSVFDFQVAHWPLCDPADAHLALCCCTAAGERIAFSTALLWMDIWRSRVLQSQGSQTTGLDVAAKSAVSKTLLLVLILSLWLVLASLPFPAWGVETGRMSYDGVQGCFLPLGQVLGCGVEIINLNLAIQTQPGHELKMPLGAFRLSQFSGRGLVSPGAVGFLEFCLLASLETCLCFSVRPHAGNTAHG